ncbi:pathogenesis-related protein PRB1-3-like [Elaeis guineensis]|uniref:Pathogenesis-related protein PRB1-3-like n=1 Tax=Elaeis guineensis var. tenera TaxID=51953 RepID=A0A6I9SGQ8_ELAGV|nr:pathogenesis-related protein PRB1-3-like [Elaeis guineensis]
MSSSNLPFVFAIAVSLGMIHTTIAQNSPEDFVSPHNSARAAVGVGPVSWNDSVAVYAQDYANQRTGDCQLVHSNGSYGENLFGGSGADYTAADAVNLWVSEKQYHDYNSNTCADGQMCGHYTQVVWRDSTSIGCARVVCDNGGIFITCNYYPPGNFVGQRPY